MKRYLLAGFLVAAIAGLLVVVNLLTPAPPLRGVAVPEPAVERLQLARVARPTLYQLELILLPDVDEFSGHADIDLVIDTSTSRLELHALDLRLEEIFIRTAAGELVAGQVDRTLPNGIVDIRFDETIDAGTATLSLDFSGDYNDQLMGLFKVQSGGDTYIFSQMQPLDARRAFPGFDEPAYKAPFDISVITREDLSVVSNGALLASQPLGRKLVRHTFARTEPIASFLTALAVGPFDIVDMPAIPPNGLRPYPLALRGITVRGKGAEIRPMLAQSAALVDYMEAYFDLGYPFGKLDLVAVPDFIPGAMENAGAVFIREEAAFLPDEPQPRHVLQLYRWQGHALAHHWIGNLVTIKWWNDLWLSESLATWMSDKAASDLGPEGDAQSFSRSGVNMAMETDAHANARLLRVPIASTEDIYAAFDVLTYQKGRGLFDMYEKFMGEERFQEGLRRYVSAHAHGLADTEDFLASLTTASGRGDISASFSTFVYQTGLPLIDIDLDCSQPARPLVRLAQSRYLPLGSTGEKDRSWIAPVCLAYGQSGNRFESCIMLEEAAETVALESDRCPAWVLPDADGKAYYRWDMPEAQWIDLFDNLDSLNSRELRAMAQNLWAGFSRGGLSLATLARAMEGFAVNDQAEALTVVLPVMDKLVEKVAQGEQVDRVQAFLRQILRPLLDRMPETSSPDVVNDVLRDRLSTFLALRADDQQIQEALAQQARDYVADPVGTIPPQPLFGALGSAVVRDGADFARALIDVALESDSARFRQFALEALSEARDRETLALAQALIFDDRLRKTEIQSLVWGLTRDPALRGESWDWLMENLDPVLDRLNEFDRNFLVFENAARFCDFNRRNRIAQTFERRFSYLPGTQRQIAYSLERVTLCATLKDKLQPELDQFRPGS